MASGGMRARPIDTVKCPCGEAHDVTARIAGFPIVVCEKAFEVALPILRLHVDGANIVLIATPDRKPLAKMALKAKA
jgi:hypothetical protein